MMQKTYNIQSVIHVISVVIRVISVVVHVISVVIHVISVSYGFAVKDLHSGKPVFC